jgi:hypothetical protein
MGVSKAPQFGFSHLRCQSRRLGVVEEPVYFAPIWSRSFSFSVETYSRMSEWENRKTRTTDA